MKNKLTKFSRRFSCEDWHRLCADPAFSEVVGRRDLRAAEIIAKKILDKEVADE